MLTQVKSIRLKSPFIQKLQMSGHCVPGRMENIGNTKVNKKCHSDLKELTGRGRTYKQVQCNQLIAIVEVWASFSGNVGERAP